MACSFGIGGYCFQVNKVIKKRRIEKWNRDLGQNIQGRSL